ncbi:nuclear transport factor 2 family protein [Corallococcus sp. H22C18031201]|uniref:ester cyclase n=1 Tax=Citreicoccus inhibens TaxID=2849499 RepID=UPI000E714ADA|nr:ester cyclase [Citreicoccus inhibens]MBU8900022.1 ester cyclase [Citreicoccus inhibens]RJS20016.1 nuclear transport factor 2 family protein [Corallococcus sp. H22C18031201]
MATIDNAAILRDIYQAFNEKDVKRVGARASPDARIVRVPSGESLGVIEDFQGWATAFPDGQVEVTQMVAQGDCVVAEIIGRGTHQGPLSSPQGPIAPTQRRVEMRLVDVYFFRDGKVTGGRTYFDAMSLMRQLGLLRAPEAPAPTASEPRPEARH